MLLFFLAARHTNTGIGSVTDGIDVPAVEGGQNLETDMPATDSHTPAVNDGGANTGASDVPAVPGTNTSTESDVPVAPKTE